MFENKQKRKKLTQDTIVYPDTIANPTLYYKIYKMFKLLN